MSSFRRFGRFRKLCADATCSQRCQLVASLAAFVILVSACGSDATKSSPTASPTTTGTSSRPSTPPTTPPPTTPPPPAGGLSVTIRTPGDGDSVPVRTTVKGLSREVSGGQVPDSPTPWIYVVIKPIPYDPAQSWWVQPYPLIQTDGSWDSFVYIGLPSDPPGTPFDICAIISKERLEVGRYGGELPPLLTRDCISVVR